LISCYILLCLAIINLLINKKIERFINYFIISASLISLVTIFHYYGFIKSFNEFGPIFSVIGQKNWTSNFLALILPSSIVFYLLETERLKKYLQLIVIIIIYTAILICQSRGIWISILLSLPIAFILIIKVNFTNIFKKNKKYLFLLLLIVIIITTVYSTENSLNKSYQTVSERAFSVFDREDTSINMRLIMLYSSLKMIQAKPLLGFGLGTFKLHYPDYQGSYFENNPQMVRYLSDDNVEMVHNEYVQMGAEIGVIGLGFFILIMLYLYIKSWKFFNVVKDNDLKQCKLKYLGIFIGVNIYLIHSLFTFPYHVAYLGASFFIMLGLAVSILKKYDLLNKDTIILKVKLRNSIKVISLIGLLIIFILFTHIYILQPYIAKIYSFKGQESYYTTENKEDAIDYFEKAARLDPNNGRNLMLLGVTYINANYLDEGIRVLRESLKLYKAKNMYHSMGLYYYKIGENSEAINIFKDTLYLYPQFVRVYNDLASLYIFQNEYQKAIEQWNKAIESNRDFNEKQLFLYNIGKAYLQMDKTENAYNYFLDALKEAPDDSTIMKDIEKELLNIFQSKDASL